MPRSPRAGQHATADLLPDSHVENGTKAPRSRANDLDGQTWTRYSISVWSDIKKSEEERGLQHPALFPEQLVRRAMDCFMAPEDDHVLDPFAGSGATIVAAERAGRRGTGIEIYDKFITIGEQRLAQRSLFDSGDAPRSQFIQANASSAPCLPRAPSGGHVCAEVKRN